MTAPAYPIGSHVTCALGRGVVVGYKTWEDGSTTHMVKMPAYPEPVSFYIRQLVDTRDVADAQLDDMEQIAPRLVYRLRRELDAADDRGLTDTLYRIDQHHTNIIARCMRETPDPITEDDLYVALGLREEV